MNERDSNIGEVGIDSIRIKGKRIDDLPLGQGNEAKEGLIAARETERINKIEGINAKYPTHRLDYLNSRINECRENINRMHKTIGEQNTMISEYRGHISMCEHRDREVTKLDEVLLRKEISFETHAEKVKALKREFPPYDIDAMNQQIKQCHQAIQRCQDVINQENKSIEEFSEVAALVKQRDKELAQYGAIAEGS